MLHHVDVAPSTMDLAHRHAAEGAPAGTAIVARRQGQGRGQQGRIWDSEDGGLWLSVVGRPDAEHGLDALSLRVGLAVADALESLVPDLPGIGLKWPNDLMLAERKLGGVLTEARWQGGRCLWVVSGIGINVHNPIRPDLVARAISLSQVANPPRASELAGPMARAVAAALRGGPLDQRELDEWAVRDTLKGRFISAPVTGIAVGITSLGALRVRTAAGEVVECSAGVVTSAS